MHLRRRHANAGSPGALPDGEASIEWLADLSTVEAKMSELRKKLSGLQRRAKKSKDREARQQVREALQQAADELSQLERQYAAAAAKRSQEAEDLERKIWEMADGKRRLEELMRTKAELTRDMQEAAIRIMEVDAPADPSQGTQKDSAREEIERDEEEMLRKLTKYTKNRIER